MIALQQYFEYLVVEYKILFHCVQSLQMTLSRLFGLIFNYLFMQRSFF